MLEREKKRAEYLRDLYYNGHVPDHEKVGSPEFRYGNPHPDTPKLLLYEASDLKNVDLPLVVEVHNYSVLAIRHMLGDEIGALNYQRSGVSEKVKVRDGLVIPRDWQVHYENLLQSNSPRLILAVMQHAFSGNPLSGELYEWSNVKSGFFGRQNPSTKRAIVGASVIGAAAALLFGS